MNNLKIMLLAATILLNHQAFAKITPEEIGEKYCEKRVDGKAVKGEVVTQKDAQKINCPGSKPNDRYFFEQENTKMAIDSSKDIDPELFKSEKWIENIKDFFKEEYVKSGRDPKQCTFSKNEFGFNVATCPEGIVLLEQVSDERKSHYEEGAKQKKEDEDDITLLKILSDDWNEKFPNSKTAFEPKIFDEIKFTSIDFGNPFARKDKNLYTPGGDVTWKTTFPELENSKLFNSTPNKFKKFNIQPKIEWKNQAFSLNGKTNAQVITKVDEKTVDEASCSDKLKNEIAKLLESDTKNIIGLQYELTVMKMASQVVGADRVSLEGLIKKSSQNIAKQEEGILNNMKQIYLRHGVKEDESKILDHLKNKSTSAYYYEKEKRFFNKDSSAFLMAFQHLNPTAGINDADISVLWFMDKVSEKAINDKKMGKFQEHHNLTNLSTRIAQYTGALKSTKLQNKEELKKSLDEKVEKQKAQIDAELMGVIESFKTSYRPCYDQIFGDDTNECNQEKVQVFFSQLLADITSKATSQEMVNLDTSLKGHIKGSKFSISKYVDKPAPVPAP